MLLCANGQSITFDADRGIIDLVRFLNTGEPKAVGEIVKTFGSRPNAWGADTLFAFLSEALRWSALEAE